MKDLVIYQKDLELDDSYSTEFLRDLRRSSGKSEHKMTKVREKHPSHISTVDLCKIMLIIHTKRRSHAVDVAAALVRCHFLCPLQGSQFVFCGLVQLTTDHFSSSLVSCQGWTRKCQCMPHIFLPCFANIFLEAEM